MQLLLAVLTESMRETVFKTTRTTERIREWTLYKLAALWTAVTLRAPRSRTQAPQRRNAPPFGADRSVVSSGDKGRQGGRVSMDSVLGPTACAEIDSGRAGIEFHRLGMDFKATEIDFDLPDREFKAAIVDEGGIRGYDSKGEPR